MHPFSNLRHLRHSLVLITHRESSPHMTKIISSDSRHIFSRGKAGDVQTRSSSQAWPHCFSYARTIGCALNSVDWACRRMRNEQLGGWLYARMNRLHRSGTNTSSVRDANDHTFDGTHWLIGDLTFALQLGSLLRTHSVSSNYICLANLPSG